MHPALSAADVEAIAAAVNDVTLQGRTPLSARAASTHAAPNEPTSRPAPRLIVRLTTVATSLTADNLRPDTLARMTDTPLRAAVIGLGAMGANHARVYAEIAGVELAAVADTDARASSRRRAAATRAATPTIAACSTKSASTC